MRSRRGQPGLAASPVLIGAVTLLVTIIAVFIAYNANSGLPFVPTYDVKAELPSGAKLVKGNEVRVGGFRVGVVDEIKPKTVEVDGERRTVRRTAPSACGRAPRSGSSTSS
jgi:ABC-type transporter Mla subunit MlaD